MLSAILAQSLMIVNLPCRILEPQQRASIRANTHDYAVLPNLDVIPDLRSLDDRPRPDVHVVADLHGVVVEVSAVRLVWRSMLSVSVV